MSSPVSAIDLDDDGDDWNTPTKRASSIPALHPPHPPPLSLPQPQPPQPNYEVIYYHAPTELPTANTATATATPMSDHVNLHDHADNECSICLEALDDQNTSSSSSSSSAGTDHHAVTIKACGHSFHQSCITECLVKTMKCPNCRTPAGRGGRPQGPSPSGTMTLRPSRHKHCPGFATGTTTIEITYLIPRGVQLSYHDQPGQPYHAITRTAYLPDNADGRALANRLKYAFDHGLTFRVGTSLTTGQTNCVTWASIHHKTSLHGGPHGFPDPHYLTNCHAALNALHVPPVVHNYDGIDTITYTMPPQLTAHVSLAVVLERWRRPPPPVIVGANTSNANTATTTTGTILSPPPPPPPPQGRSPSGKMTIERSPENCPGFGRATGCFRIIYSLPSGTQLSYHPHPHTPYPSTMRCCYLPDTVEGVVLLQRIKYAFLHGLIFDVGTSLTTGKSDQIIWSTIPHKTSLREPGSPFSFPDPHYLTDCHVKLDQAGVPHSITIGSVPYSNTIV